jgi:putative 4-mercaptohistidine N1-methyltranferase
MASDFYESDDAVAQYLLFHYGTPEQICPLLPEARVACDFPARSVSEPLAHLTLTHTARALDLGCAVGRASFELARHFDQVVGIDFSRRFIDAAQRMRENKSAVVRVPREGALTDEVTLQLPPGLAPECVHFETGDACNLRADLGTFDLVLMANLIDRLPDPAIALARAATLIEPGGWLVLTSPYTWLEEYTPRAKWIGDGEGTLAALEKTLRPTFALRHTLDLPFLIREHLRKYQWSIAQGSIWQRI